MNTKITLTVFFVATLLIVLIFGCNKRTDIVVEPTERKKHTTLVLGIENRGSLVRGWNDLTMLVIEDKGKIKIISFPRDTFVYISPKGYWTMNSMYLVLGIKGMVNYFNYNFNNLKIDDYLVYNMDDIDKLAKKVEGVPGLPKRFKRMFGHYEYINDWVRHRHKLRYEIDRQRRIHAFTEYLFEKLNKKKMPKMVVGLATGLMVDHAENTSFDKTGLQDFYYSAVGKQVEYHIWDGYHQNVDFRLQHAYNRRIFQKGLKTVYVLKHRNLNKLDAPYTNCYKFSTENFFELVSDKIPIDMRSGIYKKAHTWNGGFTINYTKLISDYQFTNQNWVDANVHAFIKSYPKNKMTTKQIQYLLDHCRKNKVNAWTMIAQIQKESCLIKNNTSFSYAWRMNNCMGYNSKFSHTNKHGERISINHGYEIQVRKGVKCLRGWFDRYTKGIEMTLLSYEGRIKPKNASSYALYKYTPFYSECYPNNNDFLSVGNRRYMAIWYNMQRKKNKMFKSKI